MPVEPKRDQPTLFKLGLSIYRPERWHLRRAMLNNDLGFLRELVWQDIAFILAALVVSRLVVLGARRAMHGLAEIVPARWRLAVLRFAPKLRLLIDIATVLVILPVLVEPTFHNTVALIATVGLALAFAFKDYGSCLIAG